MQLVGALSPSLPLSISPSLSLPLALHLYTCTSSHASLSHAFALPLFSSLSPMQAPLMGTQLMMIKIYTDLLILYKLNKI